MKNLLRYLTALCIAVAGFGFTACEDSPEEPAPGPTPEVADLDIAVVEESISYTSATLNLTPKGGVNKAAWSVGGELPDADVLLATGNVVTLKEGNNAVVVRGLEAGIENIVYIAYADNEKSYVVKSVTIVTPDYDSTVPCEIVEVWGSGYKVRLNAVSPRIGAPVEGENITPENIGTSLRWGQMSLFMYNVNKMNGLPLFQMLDLNPNIYTKSVLTESTTLTIDEYNSYERDENGNLVYHDWNGDIIANPSEGDEPTSYFGPIVPGQPNVFVYGEFRYDPTGDDPQNFWYIPGYCVALIDIEAYYNALGGGDIWSRNATRAPEISFSDEAYWYEGSQHGAVFVRTDEPVALDEKCLDVEVISSPKDIAVRITPDESVALYSLLALDPDSYEMVKMLLGGTEDYMQWFTSSYDAMFNFGTMQLEGEQEVHLAEFFYGLSQDTEYKILINAIGTDVDADGNLTGSKQCFKMVTAKLTEATEPAPKITISPVACDDPYTVAFKVQKDPSSTTDITEAKYVCNDLRDWKKSYDDGQLLDVYGQSLNADAISMINSADGLVLTFSTYADTEVKCAVMGANYEGTWSEPVSAVARSIEAPAPDKVDSPYYTSLLGDWTATAMVKYTYYGDLDPETGQQIIEERTGSFSSKVTMGNIDYPATLSDDVYAIFANAGVSKEETDTYYSELKKHIDKFNASTAANNRILCKGFNFNPQEGSQELEYLSPYDLFISPSYNGATSESPVWEFGPKWYLEVQKDGSLAVPFNASRFAPMTAHYYNTKRWLVGASQTAALPYIDEDMTGYFPVEVSADGNTITVKALSYNGDTYYPNSAYYSTYGGWSMYQIVSDIVLTRGYTEPASTAAVKTGEVKAVKINSNGECKFATAPMPMTSFPKGVEPVEYKQTTYNIVTFDQAKARMKSLSEKMLKGGKVRK